jgi:ammonia channel protein AmtB
MQRLTVVSACGMVGTVATGFLGMNLFSHSDLGGAERLAIFFIVFIPTIVLTMYTLSISRRLATFMEALASERLTWGEKQDAFRQIWFAAKRAKTTRIEAGEVVARRPRRMPEASEPAHSAD